MYYFINAEKDASVYSLNPNQNTGLDEILEVSKNYVLGSKNISRALLKFPQDKLLQTSSSVDVNKVELILRECEASEIPIDYTLYAYPVSQSWEMGIGTKYDEISTDGVTWRNATTSTLWASSGSDYITGSVSGSQSFDYKSADINMDLTGLFNSWTDSSLENNGIVLKHHTLIEADVEDYGELKFFSKETNTVYQPKLRIGVLDSSFSTGSLQELTADDIHVFFRRLKTTYNVNSEPKIEVVGRELYPLKNYSNQYAYTDNKYLPETTYYQIRDAITDEIILPFSDYTKVSCDSDGNYFKLNFVNWETNREYYIEIKVERSDGSIEYFSDDDMTFSVEE